jgi:hypothetical protein
MKKIFVDLSALSRKNNETRKRKLLVMKKLLYTFVLSGLVLPQLSFAGYSDKYMEVVSSETRISPGSQGGIAASHYHGYPIEEDKKKDFEAKLQPLPK